MNHKESMEINIRHFLVIALGQNQFLHEFIDEIYEKRKWEYYEHFKDSGFVDELLMKRYSLKSEYYIRKVAGIVQWSYDKEDLSLIYKLIKKGYKFASNYVAHRRSIDIEEFVMAYLKKYGGINKVSEITMFLNSIIIIYLCSKENKFVSFKSHYGEQFLNGLNNMAFEVFLDKFKLEQLKKENEKLEIMYETLNVPKISDIDSIGKYMDILIMNEETELSKSEFYTSYERLRNEAYNKGIMKYIGALSSWVKTVGFEPMDITENILFTQDDLDLMVYECIDATKGNSLSKEDYKLFYVACMYIWAFAKLYKEAKDLYLNNSIEDAYLNVTKKEKLIKEKEAEIENLQKQLITESANLENKYKLLEEEHYALKRKMMQQQQEYSQITNYEREVFALREYIYNQEDNNDYELSLPSTEKLVSELNELKLVIFGGHPNWKNKMKKLLPNVQYIDVDNINLDISFIDKVHYVFINTSYFNHGFYKKLMGRLNKNKTPFNYLKGNDNINKNIEEIYHTLYKI